MNKLNKNMLLEVKMPSANEVTTSGLPIIYRVGFKKDVASIFKNGYNRQFAGMAGGLMYGVGTYCNDNLHDAKASVGVKEYGDTIFKMYLAGGYYGFVIFNERRAKEVYGRNWNIFDQLRTVYNATDDEIREIKRSCDSYIRSDGGTYHHGRTGPAAHGFSKCKSFIIKHKVKGVVYKGNRDGDCVVPYDFGSIIPYSVSYDRGRTFQTLFNAQEYEERINRSVDVQFHYGNKYKSVFEPVGGFAMVISKQGKYNFVNIKTDEELSPIWFDMIDMPIDADTHEFAFTYKGISMEATAADTPDDNGNIHKGCVLNNGVPYFDFSELDDYVNYVKSNNGNVTENRIINEMFGEDHKHFDIPKEDEIRSDKMVAIYRATPSEHLESIFKNGFNRQFTGSHGGNAYGEGTYCMETFEAALHNVPGYGDTVVKMYVIGGFENFLIYHESTAKQVYGKNWRIEDQLKNVLNVPDRLAYNLRSSGSAGRYQDVVKKYGIRGMIYRWGAGYAVNVFDFNCTIPYAVYYPRERKWVTKFNFEYFSNRMKNNADVHFRYDQRYSKVFEAVAGYVMVGNEKGKYNFVDIRNDEEVSPIWFDMINMPLDADTKEFTFTYKGITMEGTVADTTDDNGNIHRGCVLNNGVPYFDFSELDDYVEYVKNNGEE